MSTTPQGRPPTDPAFAIHDGQFWLYGQPFFIHAGELHYFRTPADQWAHRLGLLKAAGFNTLATYIPWLWHQPEPGLSDLDGHTHPLRNLAGFLDLAASMDLYIIPRPGPYIMAETINEGIPPWVFREHPAAAFIAQDGSRQVLASYLHPGFLSCVEGWYAAVFAVLAPRQITRGGRILLTQLDNEMGMLQWLRNLLDVNPDTLARFATYLRAQYGDRLAMRYPTTDLIAFLHHQITRPEPPFAASVVEDYRHFYRMYLRDYAAHLWERARAYGMETPPVMNIHGFGNGGKTFPIGLSQLSEVLTIDGVVSATDVYPLHLDEGNLHHILLVNAMTKALQNPAQPLFSIEFQAGGNQDFGGAQSSLYDLHSRLSIACGMRAINHYLFFDGENDPILSSTRRHDWGHPVRKDGTLRRHYARYPRLSRALAAYGPDLLAARPQTVTTIGFQLDAFMTEVGNAETRPAADILTHQREVILFDLIARGLALSHRPFNALELTRDALDPARTPTLWTMLDHQCDAATQQKLIDYVQRGGKLVIVGRLPLETLDHAPCTLLRDALGVEAADADPPFTSASIAAFGYPHIPAAFVERYTGAFDEVIATASDGQVVGFLRALGAGQALVLGAAFPANTLEDLDVVEQVAQRIGCAPAFVLSEWADVHASTSENGTFLFVANYQDDPIATTITATIPITKGGAAGPLFGGHPITLPARRGAILPLEWRIRPGLALHYATAELTELIDDGTRLTLHFDQPDFVAEFTLSGFRCEGAVSVGGAEPTRQRLQGSNGALTVTRI